MTACSWWQHAFLQVSGTSGPSVFTEEVKKRVPEFCDFVFCLHFVHTLYLLRLSV